MGKVALVFIIVFYVILLIPCIGVGWIGRNLLDKLGRYPSKTPAVQMSVLFKLIVVEVVSVTLLLSFFKALVAE